MVDLDELDRLLGIAASLEDECLRCHAAFSLHDGDDPTPLCDHCAQELLADHVPALICELRAARETNARLNRRCQAYEAGIREKIATHPVGSFGRSLAHAAWVMAQEELLAAEASLAEARARIAELERKEELHGAEVTGGVTEGEP